MAPINEEIEIYSIGTTIRKKFNNFNHVGQVIKYNKENEWYTIEYRDGDWEEMGQQEVEQYKSIVDLSTLDNVQRLT